MTAHIREQVLFPARDGWDILRRKRPRQDRVTGITGAASEGSP